MKSYEQAIDEGYLAPWKVLDCEKGPTCWCKRIVLIDPIKYNYINSDGNAEELFHRTIIDSAILDKKMAEYIVNLHNEKIFSK